MHPEGADVLRILHGNFPETRKARTRREERGLARKARIQECRGRLRSSLTTALQTPASKRTVVLSHAA